MYPAEFRRRIGSRTESVMVKDAAGERELFGMGFERVAKIGDTLTVVKPQRFLTPASIASAALEVLGRDGDVARAAGKINSIYDQMFQRAPEPPLPFEVKPEGTKQVTLYRVL